MKYKDVESQFLEAIASQYGFDGNTRTAFIIRFSEKDAEMSNANLSIQYENDLTINTRERREQKNSRKKLKEPDACTILRDRLKVICGKFEEQGCQYNGKIQGRWKIAKAWLRETKFPEWVRQQQELDNPLSLWQQLWNQATSTKGIIVRDTAKPNVLGIDPTAWGGKKETVPQFSSTESKLVYEINIEQGGYLILLEKSPDQLYCFSPSALVERFYHSAGTHNFPYQNNLYKLAHIPLQAGIVGTEEIIAIVSKTKPDINWLQSTKNDPFELKPNHLKDLLDFIGREPALAIMNTKYAITA